MGVAKGLKSTLQSGRGRKVHSQSLSSDTSWPWQTISDLALTGEWERGKGGRRDNMATLITNYRQTKCIAPSTSTGETALFQQLNNTSFPATTYTPWGTPDLWNTYSHSLYFCTEIKYSQQSPMKISYCRASGILKTVQDKTRLNWIDTACRLVIRSTEFCPDRGRSRFAR